MFNSLLYNNKKKKNRSTPSLMPGFINTDYSQVISYSVIRQQVRFINLKSQFILWLSRRELISRYRVNKQWLASK